MTNRQKAYEDMVYAAGLAVDQLWAVEQTLRGRPEAERIREIYIDLRNAQNACDRLWGF